MVIVCWKGWLILAWVWLAAQTVHSLRTVTKPQLPLNPPKPITGHEEPVKTCKMNAWTEETWSLSISWIAGERGFLEEWVWLNLRRNYMTFVLVPKVFFRKINDHLSFKALVSLRSVCRSVWALAEVETIPAFYVSEENVEIVEF